MADDSFTLRATFMHTPVFGVSEVLEDALVTVVDGVITDVCNGGHPDWKRTLDQAPRLVELPSAMRVLPGLVDTHVHAPQWPQLGKALHLPLEKWLLENTFPLEARYADAQFARAMYDDLVRTLVGNGTTTAVYYGTIHTEANQILARTCLDRGQRAFIGKVAMDHPEQCPDYYRDASAGDALAQTRDFVHWVRELAGNETARVQPIVTPRFIPSCTDALLAGLGGLAAELDCHIQTHCSESDWEHQFVIERLGTTDTVALDNFDLVTRHTVLAHGNFISGGDVERLVSRGAGVSHCPLSNHYFANSIFPLREMIQRGVRMGLGTDISGGHSASMLDSCRSAVSASRSLNDGVDPGLGAATRGRPGATIDFRHAFWAATVGGGDMLDIRVGKFAPGYYFDAIAIDTGSGNSNVRYFKDVDSNEDLFQKIVYTAERHDIARVWIGGREPEPMSDLSPINQPA